MSRDAKVGLVIVFAFVFLLGTIVVHRFHFANPDQTTGGMETAAAGPDAIATDGNDEPYEDVSASSNSSTVTTVDARPAETLNPPLAGSGVGRPVDSSFSASQKLVGQSNSSRPPVEPPKPSDSGAYISLTDPRDDRPSAAVVEHAGSSKKPLGSGASTGRPSEADMPETQAAAPSRSPALLEITNRSPASRRNLPGIPDTESEGSAALAEVNSLDLKQSSQNLSGAVTSPPQDDAELMAESSADRRIPPLNRPPIEPDDDPNELATDSASIQQAAGRRRPDSEETLPPKLPKYDEPPQPTIESVPDRGSRPTPHGADRSSIATEPFSPTHRTPPSKSGQSDDYHLAGQKTYVVKEGDSFWSISAKQYGTGKYFRELEKFNWERLVGPGGDDRDGDTRRQLVPGLTIIVPDISVLRSKSAVGNPSTAAPAGRASGQSLTESRAGESRTSRDGGPRRDRDLPSAPGTYRVKAGDTLSTISLRELGTSKRWQEIFQLNRDQLHDPLDLQAGMVLKMPPATAEKAAGRPSF